MIRGTPRVGGKRARVRYRGQQRHRAQPGSCIFKLRYLHKVQRLNCSFLCRLPPMQSVPSSETGLQITICNYHGFFFGEMTQNLAVIKHFYSKATQCCMTKRASFFELTEGESRLFHCRETNI